MFGSLCKVCQDRYEKAVSCLIVHADDAYDAPLWRVYKVKVDLNRRHIYEIIVRPAHVSPAECLDSDVESLFEKRSAFVLIAGKNDADGERAFDEIVSTEPLGHYRCIVCNTRPEGVLDTTYIRRLVEQNIPALREWQHILNRARALLKK